MTPRNVLVVLAFLIVFPAVLAGCLSSKPGTGSSNELPEIRAAVSEVVVDEFCVQTTDVVFGLPLVIRGTRFAVAPFDPTRPALVLTHGVASTRDYLDGWWLDERLTGDDSLARTIAASGVNVFTFDRPGYGESLWEVGPRDGRSLGTKAQIDAMRDVVASVRSGSYRVLVEHCSVGKTPEAGSDTVLLGGHSMGGALARIYLGTVGDVDGAIVLHFGAARVSPTIMRAFLECSTEDPAAEWFHMLCKPEYYGHLFAPEIMDVGEVASMVDYDAIPKDPRGMGDAGLTVPSADVHIQNTPAIPVLLVNGALDYVFVDAEGKGSYMEMDASQWEEHCRCDATYWTQPGAGHFAFLLEQRAVTFDAILRWLSEHGFVEEATGTTVTPEVAEFTLSGCDVGRWFFFIPETTAKAFLPTGFTPTDAAVAFRTLSLPVPDNLPDTGRAVAAFDAWSCASSTLGPGPAVSSGVYILVDPPVLPGVSTYPEATQDLYVVSYGLETQSYIDLMARWMPPEIIPVLDVTLEKQAPLGFGPTKGQARVEEDGRTLFLSSFTAMRSPAGGDLDARFRAYYVTDEGTLRKDFVEVAPLWAGGVEACAHKTGSPYANASGTTDCRSNAGGVLMSWGMEAPARVEFFPGVFPVVVPGL